jgi:hypothetical protein
MLNAHFALFGPVSLESDIEKIGLDDEFVELGGDSISSMRFAAAARDKGWNTSVASIFALRTLEAISSAAVRSDSRLVADVKPFIVLETASKLLPRVSRHLGIPVEIIEDILPCTPFQEEMMLESQQRAGAVTMRFVYDIAAFKLDRFMDAWEECHQAHAALRTRMILLDGWLVQAIVRDRSKWIFADDLDDFLEQNRKSPMATGCRLNRCAVVHDSGMPKYFVWTAHHAIYDGWSMQALLREFCQRYMGQTMSFNPDPGPASFLHHFKGLERPNMESFWKRELSDLSSKPMLGIQPQPSPCANRFTLRVIRFSVPHNRTFTSATLLQFCWALLLSVGSGSDDVVLELMLTGRTAPIANIEHVLFPTVATVPFRFRFCRMERVLDSLIRMQAQTHALSQHEQLGWRTILDLDASSKQTIRSTAMPLIIHPASSEGPTIDGYGLDVVKVSPMTPHNVAIQADCALDSTGAEVVIVYDDRIFPKDHVERLLDGLERILEAVSRVEGDVLIHAILESDTVDEVRKLRLERVCPADA